MILLSDQFQFAFFLLRAVSRHKIQRYWYPKPLYHKPWYPKLWYPKPLYPKPWYSKLSYSKPWYPKPWYPKPLYPKPWYSKLWYSKPWYPKPWYRKLWYPKPLYPKPWYSKLISIHNKYNMYSTLAEIGFLTKLSNTWHKWRKEMFYLTTHSTHLIYGYMVLLYAPSRRQDNTYHVHTSHGALAGTRNISMGPPWRIDPTIHRSINVFLQLFKYLNVFQGYRVLWRHS